MAEACFSVKQIIFHLLVCVSMHHSSQGQESPLYVDFVSMTLAMKSRCSTIFITVLKTHAPNLLLLLFLYTLATHTRVLKLLICYNSIARFALLFIQTDRQRSTTDERRASGRVRKSHERGLRRTVASKRRANQSGGMPEATFFHASTSASASAIYLTTL